MDLNSAKLNVALYLSSLLTDSSQNSKYVVSISSKQKTLKCEKIFYLIILYCLDFYNELSEEFKYRIQEVINELPNTDASQYVATYDKIVIPEEYLCLFIKVLEYFLTNIDTILDDCESECFCSYNAMNCFITFFLALELINNGRDKEGELLISFIKGQLENIYREGVEYENTFYINDEQELYGFVDCPYDKCYVDTKNINTMFDFINNSIFNLQLQNSDLYGNK